MDGGGGWDGRIPILTNMFQMGWNHQPAVNWFSFRTFEASTVWESLVFGPFSILQKTRGARGTFKFFAGDLAIPTWTVSSRFLGSEPHIASVACYLRLKRCQIRPKVRSLKNTKFEELNLLIPIWIEMSVSPGWDPKPKSDSHMPHIRGFEKLNQHESTSFFPEKLLSKISNCVQLGNDLRFGIPFITGKRDDFSMETLKEEGFLWLPFVWIWCQSKLGVSNSFFSLGTTPLWLRILFVVVLVSTCCAKKKHGRFGEDVSGWDGSWVGRRICWWCEKASPVQSMTVSQLQGGASDTVVKGIVTSWIVQVGIPLPTPYHPRNKDMFLVKGMMNQHYFLRLGRALRKSTVSSLSW